jgi:L-ascorbate metabolism protein UlaG (beta-lactamase superfamily)
MSGEKYLAPNAVIEPLFNQWYAWSHLISPATAPLHVGNHLKIMRSYVKAPQLHAAAIEEGNMVGGAFIDYKGERADEIAALIDSTERRLAPQLQVGEALRALDAVLGAEAQGYALEPLYAKVPDCLRGYVELFYDLDNRASFRVIEGLLYRSRCYDPSLQSIALSRVTSDEQRSFTLSTPRLPDRQHLHLQVPLKHPGIDALSAMRFQARRPDEIAELLGVQAADRPRLEALFVETPPPRPAVYDGPGARVRYLGHACVLIEAGGRSVLFDPAMSYKYPTELERDTLTDLPERIDCVLVTHNHQDHLLIESMMQLRHKTEQVVVPRSGGGLADPSIKRMLEAIGFSHVAELDETDSWKVGDIEITALPFLGEHADLDIRSKVAYHVRAGGASIVLAADSRNLEPKLYELIRSWIGPVDVLFLGMECEGAPLSWLYGSLLAKPINRKQDQSRRLNGSDAAMALDVVERLGCKQVFIYAMGQEPWLGHIMGIRYTEESKAIVESNRVIEACRHKGIEAERLWCRKTLLV